MAAPQPIALVAYLGRSRGIIGAVGFRFYLALGGAALGIGLLVWVGMLVFARAVYAWGFLGVFLVLAVILVLIGWIADRREARIRDV